MDGRIVSIFVVGASMAFGASTALADAGAPGTTFPEQPGSHAQTACAAVTTNPGSGMTGQAGQVISPTAGAIVGGLVQDACSDG
jgi:hypothetical protein